jgi:PAS domain S-box-containing protein
VRLDLSLPRWLGNASIAAKLATSFLAFLLATTVLLTAVTLIFQVLSGVRAYVGGEGLWSKGQKDAVYALHRYLDSQDSADYRAFEQAIAMPLGDRRARLEMEKPSYDPALVRQGFVDGGIDAADVPALEFLFRHFRDFAYFSDAISIWRQAEVYVLDLEACGKELHALIRQGPLTAAQTEAFRRRIDHINTAVTPLEQRFSSTLAEGARATQGLLLTLVLVMAALLTSFVLWISWRISRELRASILGLRLGAQQVRYGDLSVEIPARSNDELGKLTREFNAMIAARRKSEHSLSTAHEFSDKVMENATNAIYALDRLGRFTLVNRRTCEISGYSREELQGQHYALMIPEAYRLDLAERFAAMIRGEGPILHYEVPLARRDGVSVVIMFSTAAMERDGQIFGAVGAAEDITERKRAESELRNRAEELARSNRELEQFAYVASHDLQEPLRTVSGFAELLAKRYQKQLGEEADEYIGFITAGTRRMKSLIEDLLRYSRVSRERTELSQVDLNTVLQTALANLQAAISGSGAHIDAGPLPSLRADRQQLVQLFQNLVGNALKFRSEAPPEVRIRAERHKGEWWFSVRDNGIGIDPASAERVFQLFQRLHTRDVYEGNGIGLTICKKIVDLHGGRIWVEPGNPGSIFYFTLPA